MRNAIDKPARRITKLTEALREKDGMIATLKRALLDEQSRSDALASQVSSCAEAATKMLSRALVAERRTAALDKLNIAAIAAIEELETKHQAATTALRSSEVMRLAAVAERDALAAQLAEVGPQIALVESKEAALTKILDGVRGRMRRKEIEAESAVLNRKAIAAVAPERNFR